MPGFPVHHQLLELAQTRVHRVGDSIQSSHLYCPLLLLPSTFPSIKLFSNESVLHISDQSIGASASAFSLSSEYLGLVSFKIDSFGYLARVFSNTTVQKPSILWCTAFFMVQLSHPYMTTGKTVSLTGWTFVGKIMSLLFICSLGWS